MGTPAKLFPQQSPDGLELACRREGTPLLAWYSRERLMSPAARAAWVEPDLAPLP